MFKHFGECIYGTLKEKVSNDDLVEVMDTSDVKLGKAEIITVLEGNKKV